MKRKKWYRVVIAAALAVSVSAGTVGMPAAGFGSEESETVFAGVSTGVTELLPGTGPEDTAVLPVSEGAENTEAVSEEPGAWAEEPADEAEELPAAETEEIFPEQPAEAPKEPEDEAAPGPEARVIETAEEFSGLPGILPEEAADRTELQTAPEETFLEVTGQPGTEEEAQAADGQASFEEFSNELPSAEDSGREPEGGINPQDSGLLPEGAVYDGNPAGDLPIFAPAEEYLIDSDNFPAVQQNAMLLLKSVLQKTGLGYSQAQNLRYGPTYYDCSSLVLMSMRELGVGSGVPWSTSDWDQKLKGMSVGDVVTFRGTSGTFSYYLAAKNVSELSQPELFRVPGSIMVYIPAGASSGHIALSLGVFARQDEGRNPAEEAAQIIAATRNYVTKQVNSLLAGTHTVPETNSLTWPAGVPVVWMDTRNLGTDIYVDGSLGGVFAKTTSQVTGKYSGIYNPIWRVESFDEKRGVCIDNSPYGPGADPTVRYLLVPVGQEEIPLDSVPSVTEIKSGEITSDGYQLNVSALAPYGIRQVRVATWTEKDGQDDIFWTDAAVNGGSASCSILVSDHGGETGNYISHVYVYDTLGRVSEPAGILSEVPDVENAAFTVTGLTAAPVNASTVALSWEQTEGAEGYLVYASTNSTSYHYVTTLNSGSSVSYEDRAADNREFNFYWVFPYRTDSLGRRISGSCEKYAAARAVYPLSPVSGMKGEGSGKGKVTIRWDAYTDLADGYVIYGMHGSSQPFGYIGYVDSAEQNWFTDQNAPDSVYSFYWVFPFYYVNSKSRQIAKCPTYTYGIGHETLPAVTGLKASAGEDGVTLTWERHEDAEGYRICAKTGAKGKLREIGGVESADILSFTDTLASSEEYTFYWVAAFYRDSAGTKVSGDLGKYVFAIMPEKQPEPVTEEPSTEEETEPESETEEETEPSTGEETEPETEEDPYVPAHVRAAEELAKTGYAFDNFVYQNISLDVCKMMFGDNNFAKQAYQYNLGATGVCYGMVATADLLKNPASDIRPSSFRDGALYASELERGDKTALVTLDEFIAAFQVAQIAPILYNEKKRIADSSMTLDEKMNAVRSELKAGKTVLLSIRGYNNGTSGTSRGHAVLAYLLEETDDEGTLYVYDPTNSTSVRKLRLTKDHGVYDSWSYVLVDGSFWGTHNYDYFSYLTADRILAAWNNRGSLSEDLESILESDADSFTVYHPDGSIAAAVIDGCLVSGDGSFTQLLMDGLTGDGAAEGRTYFYMPSGESYVIRTEDPSLRVSLVNADQTTTVETKGGEILIVPDIDGSVSVSLPEGEAYHIRADYFGTDIPYEIDGIADTGIIDIP